MADSKNITVEALYTKSTENFDDKPVVAGYEFDQGLDYEKLMKSLTTTGFQATNFGLAVDQINQMLKHRNDEVIPPETVEGDEGDDFVTRRNGCTIFLGFTSNMSSAGTRDVIRFLVQHKLVDCIVTTAGGVEEDLMKCMADTYVGHFGLKGDELRGKRVNRIANLLVPNDNYCLLQEWLEPVLDELLEEQKERPSAWTPSQIIERFGHKINDKRSFCYWAAVNKIPIFSPALTDGALGDTMYLHALRYAPADRLVIDLIGDICRINACVMNAQKTGVLIMGAGLAKHHILNANLKRDGADFAVIINSVADYDGSDAGASPDEAISWGKIRREAKPVKITADASFIFPLLVAETFAKQVHIAVQNSH